MITMSRLGRMGRLGNQMFQYAMLLELQERYGYEVAIPTSSSCCAGGDRIDSGAFRLSARSLEANQVPRLDNTFVEARRPFDPAVFDIDDGTDLIGYFQSAQYFQASVDRIRSEFTFQPPLQNAANVLLKQISAEADGRPLCGIHVRRGDYLQENAARPGSRHVLTPGDIVELKRRFADRQIDAAYVVASDDIRWCRDNLGAEHFFLAGRSHFFDMCVLSQCDHMILSCSSFSWWAAYLQDSSERLRVVPGLWHPDRNIRSAQICPKHWLCIDLPDR